MIQVTQEAATRLAEERAERGLAPTAGVRFLPMAFGVGMTFLRGPKRGDEVVTRRDIRFFIAPDVIAKLKGATLDLRDKGGKRSLVLRAPRRMAA